IISAVLWQPMLRLHDGLRFVELFFARIFMFFPPFLYFQSIDFKIHSYLFFVSYFFLFIRTLKNLIPESYSISKKLFFIPMLHMYIFFISYHVTYSYISCVNWYPCFIVTYFQVNNCKISFTFSYKIKIYYPLPFFFS